MSEQNQINYDKQRWFVLIASCLMNLCIESLYAWSVFSTPLAEKLNTLIVGGTYTAAGLAVIGIFLTVLYRFLNQRQK